MNILKGFLFLLIMSVCFAGYAYSQTVPSQIIGKPVSDIKGKTLDGKSFSLNENFRGAPTVIVFWSTTCPICHANIPKMNDMNARFESAGKKANFLGVTLDNPSKVENYIKKYPFNFTLVPNGATSLIEYAPKKNGVAAFAYPSIFVVDKSGTLVYAKEGGGQTEKIEELLNSLLQAK